MFSLNGTETMTITLHLSEELQRQLEQRAAASGCPDVTAYVQKLVEQDVQHSPGEYVEQTVDGGWRLRHSRISLASVIHAWSEGQTPEVIVEEFPTLSARQVRGALAFYLENKSEIDRYLAAQDEKWEQLRQESQTQHGQLLDRIRTARKSTGREGPTS